MDVSISSVIYRLNFISANDSFNSNYCDIRCQTLTNSYSSSLLDNLLVHITVKEST